MTRRARRILIVLGATVAAVVVIAIAASLWLVGTERGTHWGIERFGAFFPGEIKVDRTKGPLRGPLTLYGLHYKSKGSDIAVDYVYLDWHLRWLPLHRLDVHRLDADGVRITLYANPQQHGAPLDTTELPDVDLPLKVMLKQARVHNVSITPAGSDSTLVIDQIDVDDAAFRDTLRIGRLSMRSPHLDVELAGHARTQGRYAVDLDATWAVREPNMPEMRGRGRLIGNLDTVRVVQDVSTPMRAHLDATGYLPLKRPRFDAALDFSQFDPRSWNPAWPRGRTSGHLEAHGTPAVFTAKGTVDATTADWGRVGAVYAVARDLQQIRIDQLAVTRPGKPGRLQVQGRVVTAGHVPKLDVHGGWQDLGWPLTSTPQVSSPRGSFKMQGAIDRYTIAADADIGTQRITPTRWRLDAAGTTQSLAVRSLSGNVLGGSVTGRGTVGWKNEPSWQLAVTGRGIDPSSAYPDWPGHVSFDARTRGQMTRGGPSADVVIDSLRGDLRHRPIAGAITASILPGGSFRLPQAGVIWGPDSLRASGNGGSSWNLTWAVSAPDVSVVVPHGSGSLRASGDVTGPRGRERIRATAQADSIRWPQGRLATAKGSADVSLANADSSRLDLDGQGVLVGQRAVEHLAIAGRGLARQHDLTVTATAQDDSLRLVARGGLERDTWRGQIATLDLRTLGTGSWSLVRPAPLEASAAAGSLHDFCWQSGNGRVCGEATWGSGAWQASARLDSVQLAVFHPIVPDAMTLTGATNGELRARGRDGKVFGSARLDIGHGDIGYLEAGKTAHLTINRGFVDASADERGLDARTSLSLGVGDSVGAALHFPQYATAGSNLGQPIHGELRASLADLGVLQAFVPQLSRTRGTITADLRVFGTAGHPRWDGDAKLAGGTADVPGLKLQVTDIVMTAHGDPNGRLTLQGGARSGNGHIDVNGEGTISPDAKLAAKATLKGENMAIARRSDEQATISPDLTVVLAGDSLRVRGEVVVPQAKLTLRRPKAGAISPTEDIVYVDTTSRVIEQIARKQLQFGVAVRLVLGDQVRVTGYGLDAKPTGSVFVFLRPDQEPRASGELKVENGTYVAYGQRLTIETGRLTFAGGPAANPGLDVRASRTANDGTVAGFEVHGTLEQPQMTVFSDPPMSQRDALGYILFGRPMTGSNTQEQGLVTEAANSLGLGSGNFVATKLASQFGISEASIQPGGTFQDSELMLGTYLSPRVYVNYGLSALDPVRRLRIQYFLNRKFTLQAETGAENSADVLYTVEH